VAVASSMSKNYTFTLLQPFCLLLLTLVPKELVILVEPPPPPKAFVLVHVKTELDCSYLTKVRPPLSSAKRV